MSVRAGDVSAVLRERLRDSPGAADPISVAFVTRQGVQHAGRATGYRNEVLSLRLDAYVGSAAVEPGSLDDDSVFALVGHPVGDLLDHEHPAIRVAALDALAQRALPAPGGATVVIPAGSSVAKSRSRARAVVDLLPALAPGASVAVVGVVNSLLAELRARGIGYLPCDLKGGLTEWGEPVHQDAGAVLARADALLVSGMTLANDTFDELLAQARDRGLPVVVFAQTGAGVFPHLLDSGVSAVSAEPYPFFWLGGEESRLRVFRRPEPSDAEAGR